ncbi:polysaccharide biosynthesis tyrosine autokinase [Brachybacterium paraconglomeratum]|uniref:polysaccharide biosynthesis tyrosine autokinase n=1 Tax=Brachybacterium paraconglomeratum TaxID=173362 RepID=UPI0037CA13C6
MELHLYLRHLREHWRSGLVVALIVILAVAGLTAMQTPIYRASTQVFVQVRPGAGVGDLNSGASYASQQIASYAELATTPYVLDQVIEEEGLDTTAQDLASSIEVNVSDGSFLIGIVVSAADPRVASRVANSAAANLQEAVASLSPEGATSSVELRVVAEAPVPTVPSSPDTMRNAMLGAVLALLAGIATALVRSLLNTRIRSVEDLQGSTDRTVLGAIPSSRGSEQASRVLIENPYSVAAEAYRELRTNLQFIKLVENRRSVLVTSSLPGEGKSTATINLAHVLAMSGERVLLIDGDLRSPSVHKILGLEGDAGLTTLLIGHAEMDEIVQSAGVDGLDVIAAGAIPPNPSELLGSPAMAEILAKASQRYDVVLIDAPPLLPVTDAAVLSQTVGGVLVVAQSEAVRRAEFERALAKLENVDANVVGLVLNRVRGLSSSQYAYASPEARALVGPVGQSADTSGNGERASFSQVLTDSEVQEKRFYAHSDGGGEYQGVLRASPPSRPARRAAVRRPSSSGSPDADAENEFERLGGRRSER